MTELTGTVVSDSQVEVATRRQRTQLASQTPVCIGPIFRTAFALLWLLPHIHDQGCSLILGATTTTTTTATTKMASDPLSSIVTALEREQIIPDVVPSSHPFAPSVLFSIVYPNGAEVNLGNELTVEETQDEPEIRLAQLNGPWDDSAEASYTLAMLDPDAPYRMDAKFRSFRHWVVRARVMSLQLW